MIFCDTKECYWHNPLAEHNCYNWNPKETCGFTLKSYTVPAHDTSIRSSLSELLESAGGGVKADSGKDRWDLLPWEQVEQVVKVLTFGAKKYDDNNWQKVTEKPRYIAAAFRHIIARVKGEHMDQETGLPHLAHAVCCLLFLLWHDTNGGE